jgi:hypothetical protein
MQAPQGNWDAIGIDPSLRVPLDTGVELNMLFVTPSPSRHYDSVPEPAWHILCLYVHSVIQCASAWAGC